MKNLSAFAATSIQVSEGVMTSNYYAHMSKAIFDVVDHEVKILYTERNAADEYYKHCWWLRPAHGFFDVMNNRFRSTTSEKSTEQDFLNECRSLVFEYCNDSRLQRVKPLHYQRKYRV